MKSWRCKTLFAQASGFGPVWCHRKISGVDTILGKFLNKKLHMHMHMHAHNFVKKNRVRTQ